MPKWIKASERLPPVNTEVIIRDDGFVYSDKAKAWHKDVTHYEWLDESDQPAPPIPSREEAQIYVDSMPFLDKKLRESNKDWFMAGYDWTVSQIGQPGDGWISVEERLPEYNEDEGCTPCIINCGYGVMEARYGSYKFYKDFDSVLGVTHWMPLPSPHKQ